MDLKLRVAEDGDFVSDDIMTNFEGQAQRELDDAITDAWDHFEAQKCRETATSATWWDLTPSEDKSADEKKEESMESVALLLDEQETALIESSRPLETVSPVAKQTRTKLETNVRNCAFVTMARHMQVSSDLRTTLEVQAEKRMTEATKEKHEVAREPMTDATEGTSVKVQQTWHKRPDAVEDEDKEEKLTPLEIRRKRNRESMQRARRRQRDDVERMKLTLQQLEQHYQELNERSQARRRRHCSRHLLTLEAEYYALTNVSHTLKEEKFLLEQMLVEKHKIYRRFQQVMTDRKHELELQCPLTTNDSTLYSDYEYIPMVEAQANEHIRHCCQQMRFFEETHKSTILHYDDVPIDDTSRVDQPRFLSPSDTTVLSSIGKCCAFPPSAAFGWEVRYEARPDDNFYVSFSKFFPGITPQEAMMCSWRRYAKPESTPFRRQLRFEILQVINDSAYIVGLDIEHPVKHDKIMRMIFLQFRMQTERGFVIGRLSVNPTSPEIRAMAERDSNFEYVDSSDWVELTGDRDHKTGVLGCYVKWISRTSYNTQEDMYVRLVNAISRTRIWEQAIVSASLSLLPS